MTVGRCPLYMNMYVYIYIYIYVCVCVCMYVNRAIHLEKERPATNQGLPTSGEYAENRARQASLLSQESGFVMCKEIKFHSL